MRKASTMLDTEALIETAVAGKKRCSTVAYLRAQGPPLLQEARRTGCSMKGLDSCTSRAQAHTTARSVGRSGANIKWYDDDGGGRGRGRRGNSGMDQGGGRGSSGDKLYMSWTHFSRVRRTADRSDPGKRTVPSDAAGATQRLRLPRGKGRKWGTFL